MIINVRHCSYSGSVGGAAKAAYRLHEALELHSQDNIKSSFYSSESRTSFKRALYSKFSRYISRQLSTLQRDDNFHMRSIAICPSFRVSDLNSSNSDIIHLHWVQSEFLSIEDIGRIAPPIVWTLHDSWAFCGSEHHPNNADYTRATNGYLTGNRPSQLTGLDLDKFCWQRKIDAWQNQIVFVCVSKWLANKASTSRIGKVHRVVTIPNAVDVRFFDNIQKVEARNYIGIPNDAKYVLISASSLLTDYNKGIHILIDALNRLSASGQLIGLITVGDDPSRPLDTCQKIRFPVKRMGYISDLSLLKLIYSSADCTIVPSYIESLPQSATESLSLGTPVIGFIGSGLEDCILEGRNGLLIKKRSPEQLASSISDFFLMQNDDLFNKSCIREHARSAWHPSIIATRYSSLYQEVVSGGA